MARPIREQFLAKVQSVVARRKLIELLGHTRLDFVGVETSEIIDFVTQRVVDGTGDEYIAKLGSKEALLEYLRRARTDA